MIFIMKTKALYRDQSQRVLALAKNRCSHDAVPVAPLALKDSIVHSKMEQTASFIIKGVPIRVSFPCLLVIIVIIVLDTFLL